MDTVSKELGEIFILAHGIANKEGIVVEHVEDTGYLLSIVKTCNNYTRAVELLQSFVDSCYREDREYFYCEGEYTFNKAYKFLKEIQNG
jgi:hypothetical protein